MGAYYSSTKAKIHIGLAATSNNQRYLNNVRLSIYLHCIKDSAFQIILLFYCVRSKNEPHNNRQFDIGLLSGRGTNEATDLIRKREFPGGAFSSLCRKNKGCLTKEDGTRCLSGHFL